MITVIGNFSLIAASMLAWLTIISPLLFKSRNNLVYYFTIFQFTLITAAFLSLIYAYLISDFSCANVATNSHTLKPLIYKFAGSWGNHEGSMLLMMMAISSFSLAFLFFSNFLVPVKTQILISQSAITFGLLLYTIITSNPFTEIYPIPKEGLGLNPLLQDMGLAFHPPILYLGYVGFSLPFSCAIAVLLNHGQVLNWPKLIKPWINLSWSFLTLGIGLGSWWAYRELGWGGFWFFDPVENASLMPWLMGTALLHSIIVCINTGHLVIWNILLSMLTFCLSLLGMFLVRSGILTSVHNFATDPERGLFILILLTTISCVSLTIFASFAHKLRLVSDAPLHQKTHQKNSSIIFANLLLVSACATILLSILYPIFYEFFSEKQITVGQPYFIATFIPIALPLLGIAAIFSPLKWSTTKLGYNWLWQSALSAGLTLVIAYLFHLSALVAIIALFLALLLSVSMLIFSCRPQSNKAMITSHLGLSIAVIAIIFASCTDSEHRILLKLNQTEQIENYQLSLQGLEYVQHENYVSHLAKIKIIMNNRLTVMEPELRYYPAEKTTTNESSIHNYLFFDLYFAVENIYDDNSCQLRIYKKPLISWLWGGVLLLVIGGVLPLIRNLNFQKLW